MNEFFDGESTGGETVGPPLGEAAACPREREIGTLDASLDDFRQWLRMRPEAVPSGVPRLDAMLGGGWHGGIISLGAPAGDGKTALAVQLAVNAARSGCKVAYLSFELGWQTVVMRLLVCISGGYSPIDRRLTMADLRHADGLDGEKRTGYTMALAELEQIAPNLYVLDGGERWPLGCGARGIVDFLAGGGPSMAVVDYLQAIPADDTEADDLRQLEGTTAALRDLARRHDMPVVVLSSLTKEGTLKGSSNITFDSSVILRLRYTELLKISKPSADALQAEKVRSPRCVSLFVEKNRDGSTGTVPLLFWPQWGTFTEIAPDERGN